MVYKIEGNAYIIRNIRLPAGGHGNILLKIKTRDNLVSGDVVSNKADIFFDYNFPVETAFANTSFQSLGINENELDNSIMIYLNPTDNGVHLNAKTIIKSVQFFDVQGRLLQTKLSDETSIVVDLSAQSSGVYFLKITTGEGMKWERLIKK